jgi:aryl-alcohol dehydrogenase-like predicted oxidoreductase
MRYAPLPNGGDKVSVLGLGCAAMMGSAGRRESLAALHAAYDAGINFFDTARSYGYGASEGLLGEFVEGRRDKVILCTKFGILSAQRNWKQSLKPLARGVLKLFPSLRASARAQAGQLFTANQFSVEVLRTSLETSLRELRTDYVDILMLHAAPIEVLAQEDLVAELERLVAQGKVRMAGISAEHDVIAATLARRPPVLETAQFACNIRNFGFLDRIGADENRSARSGMFLVANHPFGGPGGIAESRRHIAGLRNNLGFGDGLRAKLDPADPQLLPEVILNAILSGTVIDAVIPAMIQPQHLKSNCRAIAECRFTADELARIRQALRAGAGFGADRSTDPPAAASTPSS